jgi:hypothetical protein
LKIAELLGFSTEDVIKSQGSTDEGDEENMKEFLMEEESRITSQSGVEVTGKNTHTNKS